MTFLKFYKSMVHSQLTVSCQIHCVKYIHKKNQKKCIYAYTSKCLEGTVPIPLLQMSPLL